MISLIVRPKALLITIPLLTLLMASHANAEIYKWRDNRGVTQYSDRPPVNSASKLTPNEIVNSLQTKDLCTVGPIKKSIATNVASTNEQSGFFTSFIKVKNILDPNKYPNKYLVTAAISNKNNAAATANGTKATAANAQKSSAVNVSRASAVTAASPNKVNSVAFGYQTKNNFTVLNFAKAAANSVTSPAVAATTPVVTAQNNPSPTAPVTAATSVAKPPVPVATAPAAAAPPTQIATAPPQAENTPPAVKNPISPISSVANIIQVALMPAVDISKNISALTGFNSSRISATNEVAPNSGGEFRTVCTISHMSNDDPLVYPNQQGAAHHHTFFGNTSINYKSNLAILSSVGNTTCRGGTVNRSAYWVPTIIDSETNAPVMPNNEAVFYYKRGVIDGSLIKAPPKGLRILAGNSKAISSDTSQHSTFTCNPGQNTNTPWSKSNVIPKPGNCKAGDTITYNVTFPQCWDGKNLDSPNHKDHMAYPDRTGPDSWVCPAKHPVPIPEIAININYNLNSISKTNKWRLASDNYQFNGSNAGYSGHGDWVNGWDETVMKGIVKNCINAKKDCHAHLLGDGRSIY